jgi:prepilin-type N-terminal cleavage/methylation domain-containing protein
MSASLARQRGGEDGFSLIETLVAMALMGLVLSALANITAQWLPNWNRGLERIQRSELIGIALQRIGADLAAAEYVSANRDARHPLFEGSELSVTFVRTALGPNAGPGLDVVRVGETTDRQGLVAAGIVAVRANSFRRTGVAVAGSVSAVVCLCRPGSDLEEQLARRRQAAGGHQADGARRGERTNPLDFDGGAGSCPVASARRVRPAGRRL